MGYTQAGILRNILGQFQSLEERTEHEREEKHRLSNRLYGALGRKWGRKELCLECRWHTPKEMWHKWLTLWDWKSRARSGWRSKCQDPQHIDGIKNLGVPKRQHQTDTQLQDAQGLSSGQRRNKSQASREERDVLDEAVAWKPGIGSVTWVDVAGRSSVPQGMEQFPLSWNKPHWREIP